MRNKNKFSRADVQLVEKKRVYDGYFKLDSYILNHPLYLGGRSENLTRLIFDRGRVGAVLPYDPYRDEVVMLEQFRPGPYAAGIDCWLLESVAGVLEEGETAEELVKREAIEEAGCSITLLEPMYCFLPSAGVSSEVVDLFCGKTDTTAVGGIHGLAEEGEDIRVQVMPRKQARQLLDTGKIVNGKTIIALQWLELNYLRLHSIWI